MPNGKGSQPPFLAAVAEDALPARKQAETLVERNQNLLKKVDQLNQRRGARGGVRPSAAAVASTWIESRWSR